MIPITRKRDAHTRNPLSLQANFADPASGFAARLDGLPALTRSYALNNLPPHLDRAGDSRSVQRLLSLAREGFPQIKAERTLDVPQSNLDYRYYFRASLRARHLSAALQLARSRADLSHLTNWLASGVLAGLLPHLGPDSKLWVQIRRAIASLDSLTLRVERLTQFHQPGLDPAMYAWMHRQFDSDAPLVRDTARTDFLVAVAMHERGAIEYVLERAEQAPMNTAFSRAVLQHIHELCDGARISPQQALAKIANLLQTHGEAFVAGVDELASMSDRSLATHGLLAFETVLPEPGASPEALICAAAVAHALAIHHELRRAEDLARRCLELVPPVPADEAIWILYNSRFIDAAERLLIAAAPFATLWPSAVPLAKELAARGSSLSDLSNALAGFLRVLPWISDSVARMKWLQETLKNVREFVNSDLDSEGLDALDFALPFRAQIHHESPRRQLSAPIEAAILEVLNHIDRVLPSEKEMRPLVELITVAGEVHARLNEDFESMLDWFEGVLVSAGRSTNISVRIVVAESFFQGTTDDPNIDLAVVLSRALPALLAGVDDRNAQLLAGGYLDSADRAWCADRPDMRSGLAHAVMAAAIAGRQRTLFDAVESRIGAWLERAESGEVSSLAIAWAATLVAFGRHAEGRELLSRIDESDRQKRREIASVLLASGAGASAAEMLASDVPADVALDDPAALEETLDVAKLLLLANGHPRARQLLLDAALGYRTRIGAVDGSAEATLLSAFRNVHDDEIIAWLLTQAETELRQPIEEDANTAARWYVTLALSASGNVVAARQAWAQIRGWKEERQRFAVRRRAVNLLANPESPDAAGQLLAAIRATPEEQECEAALFRACRLIGHVDAEVRSCLVDGILQIATTFVRGERQKLRILSALCGALVDSPDDAMLAKSTTHWVVDFIAGMSALTDEGAFTNILHSLFRLMRRYDLDAGEDWTTLLERITHSNAGSLEEGLFAEALELGADLGVAISVCDKLAPQERWSFLGVATHHAVKRSDIAHLDQSIAGQIALMDTIGGMDSWSDVKLSAAYVTCRTVASPGIVAEIESRLRTYGPPSRAVAVVRWASNLVGTPLERDGADALSSLGRDLDRFAVRPDDLQSLEAFLRTVMPPDRDAAVALFDAVSDWASRMPLVTNEDWRHEAFIQIVHATSDLHPEIRSIVQRQALERAFNSLKEFPLERFAKALVSFPVDAETARWALSRWLDCAQEIQTQPLELLVDLLVTSLEHRNGVATTTVLDAFLSRIAQGVPLTLNREATARAACESPFEPLRVRLSELLLHDYDTKGLATLTNWDLAFLASKPLTWWVERSPLIGVHAANVGMLSGWIERVVRVSADASWWSVVLATEWLSRSDPQDVQDLWFDLCTLPASFPVETRKTILKAI